jgi:hypothetical protein
VTTDLWLAIAILSVLIALVLWGTRGHSKRGNGARDAGSDGGVRADIDMTTGGGSGGDGGGGD